MIEKKVENELLCCKVGFEIFIKGKSSYTETLEGCQQQDGSWESTE